METTEPETSGPARVLVIDDEPAIRSLLRRSLQSQGHAVTQAGGGREGLDALAGCDVVLLDLTLPDMNGLEVLRRLKALRPQAEVIIMTGHGSVETALESMRLGACDYVTKPFDLKDLQCRVEKALERGRLTRKVDQLQELNRLKSEFLANMSHELRTPMNAIIGYTSLMADRVFGELTEKQAQALSRVDANAKNLLQIINNILDLSKLNAQRMPVYAEECPLKDLVLEVAQTMESLARPKNLRLSGSAPEGLTVRTDKTKLRQVLVNLVGNAVKFTKEGVVEIRARAAAEPGRVELRVRDTGVGIRPEDLPLLFEEFKQLDSSSTREFGGTGLGLAISKKLIELLGGTIRAESAPGQGSTFIVSLPAEETDLKPQNLAPLLERDMEGRKVLLAIDDDPEVLALLKESVSGTGIAFAGAQTGDEGVAMARRLKPFVITLDVMMPHRDGWSVLQTLKADLELKDIPVIIVSIVENKALGYALGVSDYIVKPFERKTLLNKIRGLEPPPTPEARPGPVRRVLVVDDDAATAEAVRAALAQEGYEAESVLEGRAVLSRIEAFRPEVLLLDLAMPGMDGFAVLRAVESAPSAAGLRVIAMSDDRLTAKQSNGLDRRVAGVLGKGSRSVAELVRELKDRLSRIQAKEALAP